jgi:hypothetical protein
MCVQCGKETIGDTIYWQDCFQIRREEINTNRVNASYSYSAGLKDHGIPLSHRGDAARKRGSSQIDRALAPKQWETANPGRLEEEKGRFVWAFQHLLTTFTMIKIMRACHCSPTYTSLIRKESIYRILVFIVKLKLWFMKKLTRGIVKID